MTFPYILAAVLGIIVALDFLGAMLQTMCDWIIDIRKKIKNNG